MISLDVQIQRNKNIGWRRVEDKIVVQDKKRMKFYTLTDTQALIWSLCQKKTTIAEIVSEIKRRYKTPTKLVDKNLKEAISNMLRAGILVKKE